MIKERIFPPCGLGPVATILDETIAAAETYMLRGYLYSVKGMHQHACGCYLKALKKVRQAKRATEMQRFWGFRR